MRQKCHFTGGLLFCLALTGLVEKANALPAFARKYATSCVTCHESFPRLNAVGEAFRLNGFKFADDEMYIKDEAVELGDDAYKRLWPSAVWPSDMPGMPPISITLDNEASYVNANARTARSEFSFPRQGKVLGAGALGDDLSFFVEVGFMRQGAGGGAHHGAATSTEGTETSLQGWVQFEDLFGYENAWNVRLGTVGMQEMGLFTARGHNRFSITNYLYSGWTMPTPSDHNIEDGIAGITDHDDIGYTGNPFNIHAQPGIELNGFGRSWRYALGLVNGNAENPSDNNNEKDVYVQLAYKVKGLGFDGSGSEEQEGLGGSSDPWRDDSLTLSFFGYHGTSAVAIERDADSFDSLEADRFWRAGPGLLWRTGNWQCGGGIIWGRNENPFGALSGGAVNSQSWFLETSCFVKPWLVAHGRFEDLTFDLPSEVTQGGEASWPRNADQSRFVVGTKALIRPNVSLGVEGVYYTKDHRQSEDGLGNKALALLRIGF